VWQTGARVSGAAMSSMRAEVFDFQADFIEFQADVIVSRADVIVWQGRRDRLARQT
jgi:hypothetical protein